MPSGVGLAHLGRLLVLADRLRQQAHVPAFAYGGPHRGFIDEAAFPCFPVAEVDVSDFDANVYALYTPEFVERALGDEQAALGAFGAEAVIADFRPTAAVSARSAGLPLVSVKNYCFTRSFDLAGVLVDRRRHPWRHRAARGAVRAIQAWQRRSLARVLARAARRRGLPQRDLFDFFEGDLDLIADIPEFIGQRDLGPRALFVGPMAWEGPLRELPPEALAGGAGRKVLYATSGNTGSAGVLDAVAAAFGARDDVRVLMTTGAYGAPERYAGVPGVRAWRFLPGSAAMSCADAVIHCGGSGTTYQCLRSGRPAVVVPANNEQRINARLVERHGTGIALDAGPLDPQRLQRAVARVLEEPAYRQRARSFADLLEEWDGPALAARATEGFLHRAPRP